jgi:hypothetical protein
LANRTGPAQEWFVQLFILQIVIAAGAVFYLGRSWWVLDRRRKASLDALLARLTPGWQAPTPGVPSRSLGKNAAARAGIPAKLWLLYRNAKTMQEIASFTLRNSPNLDQAPVANPGRAILDRAVVEELHRDATYLRFRVLAELALYAFGRPITLA